MLKQRLITAAILLVAVSGVIYLAPAIVFEAVTVIILLLATWEWAGLLQESEPPMATRIALQVAVVITLILCQHAYLQNILAVGVVMALWGSTAVITFNRKQKPAGLEIPLLNTLACIALIVPTTFALLALRGSEHGAGLVFYALSLVIINDSAAYFGGRWIGKRKLAPLVSPKKTWEGCFCGFVAGLIWSVLITLTCWPNTFNALTMALIAIPTLVAAIMGDLFISVLKRQVNLKDTGDILPGHGGLLDRIDAVLMALPVFAFCLVCLQLV